MLHVHHLWMVNLDKQNTCRKSKFVNICRRKISSTCGGVVTVPHPLAGRLHTNKSAAVLPDRAASCYSLCSERRKGQNFAFLLLHRVCLLIPVSDSSWPQLADSSSFLNICCHLPGISSCRPVMCHAAHNPTRKSEPAASRCGQVGGGGAVLAHDAPVPLSYTAQNAGSHVHGVTAAAGPRRQSHCCSRPTGAARDAVWRWRRWAVCVTWRPRGGGAGS